MRSERRSEGRADEGASVAMASPTDNMELAGSVDGSALEARESEVVAAEGAASSTAESMTPTSSITPAAASSAAGAPATATTDEPAAGEELTKVGYVNVIESPRKQLACFYKNV